MFTSYSLKGWLAVIVSLVVGLALFFIFFMPVVHQSYRTERLMEMEWGEGPSQVGIERNTDGSRSGPRSFDTDRAGQIYLADTVQQQIEVFDPSGQRLGAWPTGLAVHDLAVSPGGRIAAVGPEDPSITVYNLQGERVKTLAVPAPSSVSQPVATVPERVDWGRSGDLYLSVVQFNQQAYIRTLYRYARDAKAPDRVEQVLLQEDGRAADHSRAPYLDFQVGQGQLILVRPGDDRFSRRIQWSASGGKQRGEFIFNLQRSISQLRIAGIDRWLDLYFVVNPGNEEALLVKTNRKGEEQFRAPLGWSGDISGFRYVQVESDGTVYVLIPGGDQLNLDRWEHERQRTLKPRF